MTINSYSLFASISLSVPLSNVVILGVLLSDDGDDEPSGDGSGGISSSSGCEAYCEAELTCDDFFDSHAECVQSCEADRDQSTACVPELDATNACVGMLDCDAFFAFWNAMALLQEGEDPGEFPCIEPMYDYVVCLDAES